MTPITRYPKDESPTPSGSPMTRRYARIALRDGEITVRLDAYGTYHGYQIEYDDGREWNDDDHEEVRFSLDGNQARELIAALAPERRRVVFLSDLEVAFLGRLLEWADSIWPSRPDDLADSRVSWLRDTLMGLVGTQTKMEPIE